jgi:hypothetical protein
MVMSSVATILKMVFLKGVRIEEIIMDAYSCSRKGSVEHFQK